jgi:hypothetical protein
MDQCRTQSPRSAARLALFSACLSPSFPDALMAGARGESAARHGAGRTRVHDFPPDFGEPAKFWTACTSWRAVLALGRAVGGLLRDDLDRVNRRLAVHPEVCKVCCSGHCAVTSWRNMAMEPD